MLLKQIKDNTDTLVDEIMSKFTKEDLDTITWRNFIRRTRPYEVKFTKVLKGLFRQQEKEVLANMRKYPHPNREAQIDTYMEVLKQNWLSDWMFTVMMWGKRFVKAGKSFIHGVMEAVGQVELDNLGIGIDFDMDSPAVISFQKKFIEKYSKTVNKATLDSLKKTLQAGIKLGEGMPDLARRVNKIFRFAEKYRATRIARTEVIRASNFGAEEAYIQSEVVKGKEWLTAFDERTCEIGCKELNGRKTGLGKPFGQQGVSANLDYTEGEIPFPPLHVSCRCALVAVLIE